MTPQNNPSDKPSDSSLSRQGLSSMELRTRFLNFFKDRGHAILASTSLVPENDPSVLFNTAGMLPLVPFLMGQDHPLGTRLASIQKCVRTVDIDDIGDKTHATFFEMMGNWSLGDYFKKEAITWSYELLTSQSGFGLDPQRLYVTCFEGNENAPRDTESADIWSSLFKEHGVTGNRIFFLPEKNNWWSPGDNGPCGPDTEMFYDVSGNHTKGLTFEEFIEADEKQELVEIWNDVFMEYEKKDGKVIGKLARKNVDTGSGFERVCMVLQGRDNIYDTDLFSPVFERYDELTENEPKDLTQEEIIKARRIIADHTRASVMLISDGVVSSNSDQGYVLRRLLRRAIRYADKIGLKEGSMFWLADAVIGIYSDVYENLAAKKETIKIAINNEETKFRNTLSKGLKEFEKIVQKNLTNQTDGVANTISGKDAFILFSTYGFPIELTQEMAKEKGISINLDEFRAEMQKHQDLSRTGAEHKFKGGLGDTSDVSVRYHTATHLLHQALREVLGTHVSQKGSNINVERLRFDFSHPAKMTDLEIKAVEDIVNEKIQQALPVHCQLLPKDEAIESGALHFFGDKYGDTVSVYFIGNNIEGAYSKEFCGGPHVENTSTLGHFKIIKEEAVAQGIRRIKAVLE